MDFLYFPRRFFGGRCFLRWRFQLIPINLIRYLYFYTIDSPEGHVKAFIDWVLSDGQQIVREVGYIPLWSK